MYLNVFYTSFLDFFNQLVKSTECNYLPVIKIVSFQMFCNFSKRKNCLELLKSNVYVMERKILSMHGYFL